MRTHTMQDIERDLSLLWEYESEGWTQVALGEREGLSQSQLSRRLARARKHRDERERAERLAEKRACQELDPFDHEYMELVGAPVEDASNEWVTIEGHEASRDRGTYHVGGRVKLLQGGVITTDDTSRTDGKPQPTNYQPDPVLKGGVG